MPREEDKQGEVAIPVISPVKMLDVRMPAMALDPRNCSASSNVTVEQGVIRKRTGYAAFSIDINGDGDFTARIQGLAQSPFGWTDDIVVLVQNGTSTLYYLYSTSGDDWVIGETVAQTAYSQLSSCPAVTSAGVEVVILSDAKARLQVWDDSQTGAANKIAALGTTAELRAKVVRYVKDHLVLFGVDEKNGSWVNSPRKVQWMNTADITDDTGGDSGSNLLLGRGGGIVVGAEMLGHDCVIYCEKQITKMVYIGGTTYFRFDDVIHDMGLAAQNAIANLDNRHLFLANDLSVWEYSGGTFARPIGDKINADIWDNINKTYYANSFFVVLKGVQEAWLFIPTTTATPDLVYVFKYGGVVEPEVWYKYSLTGFCGVEYDIFYALTGGTALINSFNLSAANDGATAIDAYWDSIDFVLPNPDQGARSLQLSFCAKGSQVDTYYSTDEGTTWTTITAGQALTSAWTVFDQDFDAGNAKTIRFRFRDDDVSKTFYIRWFQPVLYPTGER